MNARNPLIPALLGALGVALATLLTAGPALAEAPAPSLSIAVDNGRTSTTVGDTLAYTITVRNLGTADVTALHVSQTMPTGLKFGSVDSAGTAEAGAVSWRLDLKAASEATVHSTMTVLDTPPELLRMATVACAGTSAAGPPIVCASHSDQLPAGAAAAAATASASSDLNWWYIAGGLGVLIVAMAVVLILRRRPTATRTRSE